jgi:hypothetical protein
VDLGPTTVRSCRWIEVDGVLTCRLLLYTADSLHILNNIPVFLVADLPLVPSADEQSWMCKATKVNLHEWPNLENLHEVKGVLQTFEP